MQVTGASKPRVVKPATHIRQHGASLAPFLLLMPSLWSSCTRCQPRAYASENTRPRKALTDSLCTPHSQGPWTCSLLSSDLLQAAAGGRLPSITSHRLLPCLPPGNCKALHLPNLTALSQLSLNDNGSHPFLSLACMSWSFSVHGEISLCFWFAVFSIASDSQSLPGLALPRRPAYSSGAYTDSLLAFCA